MPFAPGAEYIDRDWILRQLDILHDIYCREIAVYDGSVSLYLADKSQHFRVPERVFFHLVESMLKNINVESDRIITQDGWEKLFGLA